jgi:hypothetical protein
MDNKLKLAIDRYNQSGRIAFLHPRSKTISLNGGPEMPFDKASIRMNEALASDINRILHQ